jgi:hypothetical protein
MLIPAEFQIGGVFMPPLFVAAILGTFVAVFTSRWLNRAGLARYLFYPPLVFVALVVIYSVLIGTFIIPG